MDDEEWFRDFAPDLVEANETEEQQVDSEPQSVYNSKKPKWWIRQSWGKGTKSQKKAMAAMEAYRLPRVARGEYIDMKTIFREKQEIWLEIGFGQGENLLANAEMHPNVGMIGVEVHRPGVGNVLKRMQECIQSKTYWTDYDKFEPSKDPYYNQQEVPEQNPNAYAESDENVPEPYSNVRVHMGDGMKLLPYLPSDSITSLFLTFPDPFPNKAHEQYRVIQIHTVREIYRVLCKKRGRFFLATDHEGYHDWCSRVFEQVNENRDCRFRQIIPCPDRSTWLPAISKYEQKGWDEGRRTLFQCWEVWAGTEY